MSSTTKALKILDRLSAEGKLGLSLNRYRADGSIIVGPTCGEPIVECEDVIRFHGKPDEADICLLSVRGFTGPKGRSQEYTGPRHVYEK